MRKNYFMYEIEALEEQIEDLQIKLEIGRAEKKIYSIAEKVCAEFVTDRNKRVEFDSIDNTIYLTIDNTDHNFEFTVEEIDNLKNEDFTEDKFDPYDYIACLGLSAKDMIEENTEELKKFIEMRINLFFNK